MMFLNFVAKEYNSIGIVGVVLILSAYLLLQLDRLSQDSILYSVMNFIGAILILTSLFYSWNLSSVIIETAWLLISFFGVIKSIYFRYRNLKV